MSGSEAVLAIVFLVVFAAGIMIGLVIMVAVAVKREDRRFSLTGEPPDAAARGARRLTGAGSRDIIYSVHDYPLCDSPRGSRRDHPRDSRRDSPVDATGDSMFDEEQLR